MALLTNNAIGWASLQMGGGWGRIAWVCPVIAIALPLVIFGSLQLQEGDAVSAQANQRTLAGWYFTLGMVQGGLLLFGLPARVFGAIKRDRVGKLIESHRLMPVPAPQAILGYMIGPNVLLLCLIGTVFAIGLFIAVPAQQDWRGWIGLHAAAMGVSVLLCCFVAFLSNWLPKFNPMLLGLFAAPMLGSLSVTLLPPLRVLFMPYVGLGFNQLQRGELRTLHIVAFASQIAFAGILFIGACRRYRRDDVPALGFGWGFALLCGWVALTLVGTLMLQPDRTLFRRDEPVRVAFVATLAISLLMAIGPIAASAIARGQWRRRRAIDRHFNERRPTPLLLATILVTLALVALMIAAPQTVGQMTSQADVVATPWAALVMTGIQIILWVATIAMLAWAAGRMRLTSTAFLIVPWLVLTWVVPPMIDSIAATLSDRLDDFPRTMSGASPPFCLSLIWGNRLSLAIPGLMAQGTLLIILACFWAFVKRWNARQTVQALPELR